MPSVLLASKHPDYPSLDVVVGGKARAGAFYVTYSGKFLSHIAKDAYGSGTLTPTLRINKSLWNQQNCTYRKKSGSCSSPIVPGTLAASQASWNPGAWLALCPGDRNELAIEKGYQYQVIWVPTADGKEPWDLDTGGKKGQFIPPPEPELTPEPDLGPIAEAGFPWWALVGIVVVGGVVYLVSRRKKK